MKKVIIIPLLLVSLLFVTGCGFGNSPQSAFEKALFAANTVTDLNRTADDTEEALDRYAGIYAQSQIDELEEDFAYASAILATDPNLSPRERADNFVKLGRRYSSESSRLRRELLEDAAKSNMIVNNIRAGAQDIVTLQMSEELESAAERDFSKFVGELIVSSANDVVTEAQTLAAQRRADERLEEALASAEDGGDEEHEEPVEPADSGEGE